MIDFPDCPVCKTSLWKEEYTGLIRDGAFGNTTSGVIKTCSSCDLTRLAEQNCLPSECYERGNYRSKLDQSGMALDHYLSHDHLTKYTLEYLWPRNLRDKTVIDVGCGAGALLDALVGVSGKVISVEPDPTWEAILKSKYDNHFNSIKDFKNSNLKADLILSMQVIEHIEDPVLFLNELRSLMRFDTELIISTPNRNEILMKAGPDIFKKFFYRSQHRWSFTVNSLQACAKEAGLIVNDIKTVHRYPFSNFIHWCIREKPEGQKALPEFSENYDRYWAGYLESSDLGDNIYMACGI